MQMELPETANLSCVLKLAANNDVDGFKKWIQRYPSSINEVEVWYVREKDLRQIMREERTPLMVAAAYGSVDVVKHILSMPEVDVNRACGANKSTPLHCAAFSGSEINAMEIVEMLLAAGADCDLTDGKALLAAAVLVVCPNLREHKSTLEKLLSGAGAEGDQGSNNLRLSAATS